MAKRIVCVTFMIVSLLTASLMASNGKARDPLRIPEDEIKSLVPKPGAKTDQCFWQSWWQNVAFYWGAPDSSGDDMFAESFTASIPHYLYITIFDDDGSGLPGAQRAQVTVPAGTYQAFPFYTTADFSSFNLVVNGDFHVGFSTDGVYPAHENCYTPEEKKFDLFSVLSRPSLHLFGLMSWVPISNQENIALQLSNQTLQKDQEHRSIAIQILGRAHFAPGRSEMLSLLF